jgi:L-lactate utilization protein LutC
MKAKTFENLIRKVVREEIDYALRREIKSLKEDLRDELKPTIVEHKERTTEIPETAKNSLREKIMGNQPIKQRPKQNFVSNGTLNDLLNETAQGDTNTETGTAAGIPVEAMPAPVQNVVNRDYRSLMQAIEKKKGKA